MIYVLIVLACIVSYAVVGAMVAYWSMNASYVDMELDDNDGAMVAIFWPLFFVVMLFVSAYCGAMYIMNLLFKKL